MLKRWLWIFVFALIGMSLNSVFAIDEVTDLAGQIAIVGADYNVYTYAADADTLTQLTSDASPTRRYQWTTWSSDGRLAYFCCEATAIGQAYVSADGISSADLLYENDGSVVIYAYWSPADCGNNCRELAMLTNNLRTGGLAVEILVDSDNPSTTTIATGGPFYYHWDSTGTQMIFHRGNQNLDIYNRAQNDISESLQDSSGVFQAPAWSPTDERVLVGLAGSGLGFSDLAILENGETTILAEDVEGLLSFLWSPDGSKIAYRTLDQFGYGGLTVLDANTGDNIPVADNTGVIAFFWSPDGNKIAYLTLDTGDSSRSANAAIRVNQNFVQDDSPTYLIWHVLDIEAETNLSYSSFIPTFEFLYLLTYFDQFAPSHRLWSPDSRYLVFMGAIKANQSAPEVYILDIDDTSAEANTVAEGVFAIWSFE